MIHQKKSKIGQFIKMYLLLSEEQRIQNNFKLHHIPKHTLLYSFL
jgi:hypothetical protein